MPIITANILSGRTTDQKRALIRGLTEAAVSALGVQHAQVRVIISEVAPENWGAGGVSKGDQEAQP